MTARLRAGDAAPDFTLTDDTLEQVSSASLRGQRTVLYFYPAAGTPGCTAQACDFRDSLSSLQGAGYRVLGVSPDEPTRLAQFRDEQSLTFPLLADPDRRVHEAFGAWGEKTVDGRTVTGAIRSTFVLDEQGTVKHALYDVPARSHVADLRRLLGLDG
jgi:peroxiredoxin Q/BCP